MRSRNFCSDAFVWKRQPLAVTTSSTPRPTQESRSSSSSLRRVSASISSSNIFRSSETGKGSCAASSAASSTIFTSFGLSIREFHVDRRKGLRLGHLEEAFPRQLEHCEEADDQDGHAARRVEQLAEFGESPSPKPPQDEAHVLSHRKLLASDAVVLGHFRTHQQRAPCFL